MVNNLPEIMTIGEIAAYLRISISSLYKLAQEGRIPCQKVGRHWRFRREAIERWLEPPTITHSANNNDPVINLEEHR
jgi:excisionase family DNA binding protein